MGKRHESLPQIPRIKEFWDDDLGSDTYYVFAILKNNENKNLAHQLRLLHKTDAILFADADICDERVHGFCADNANTRFLQRH